MIGEVIKNSAVNAKIHAKLKNSLKAKDYDKMVSFSTVSQLAAFLKQNAEYKEALADVSAESIHRGELERRLKTVINKNIRSLITFSSESDKAFLTLFDIRDEIWNLKILLRLLFRPSEGYSPNYIETGTLDYEKLFRARTFEDFTELLKDTVYYKVFKPFLAHPEKQSLFELETALDSLYQDLTFEYIKKYLSKEEQKIAEKSYGTEVDLQTILFIIRAKIYYGFTAEQVLPYVSGKRYRLKEEDIRALAQADSKEAALDAAKNTCYKELFEGSLNGIEAKVSAYSLKMHKSGFKRKPYSLESVLCYIKIREVEVRNVIMITEGIRYGLPPQEIRSYVIGID